MDTEHELNKIQDFLGRSHSSNIKKILNQQKIPRKQLSQGRGHASYGWKMVETCNEKEEYNKQIKFIYENASKKIIKKFNKLIEKYNEKWPSILNRYHY